MNASQPLQPKSRLPRQSHIGAAASGFSLIEILTVLAIIGFIAAFLVTIGLRASDSAKIKAAKAQLQKLSIALDRYYLECGRTYPPDSGYGLSRTGPYAGQITGYDPGSLWRYLGQRIIYKTDVSDPGVTRGPYVAFSEIELAPYSDPVLGPSYYVVDPWRTAVGYVGDPRRVIHRRGEYDLFSAGPNRKTACDDGIDNGVLFNVPNNAYDGVSSANGIVGGVGVMGEAQLNGTLTASKKSRLANEVLDDINNWDAQ